MAISVAYEGEISGAAIAAAITNISGALVIPSAGGQQVIILEE